jgi:hypothetical protein
MLYVFTNRRRAKDSIMLIADKFGTDGTTVFVREGLVYVDADDAIPDVGLILHYAEPCQGGVENFLVLDEIEELYRCDGIRKFRV